MAQKHCTGCGVLLIGGREQDMLSADISMPPASCQSDGIFTSSLALGVKLSLSKTVRS